MQYHAIPYNTMQYHAIPCNTMQYHAISCNAMQCHAIPYNTMQYHANHAIPCNTMQYHAIPCNTMQYHAIPCFINICWRSIPSTCGQYKAFLQYIWEVSGRCSTISLAGQQLALGQLINRWELTSWSYSVFQWSSDQLIGDHIQCFILSLCLGHSCGLCIRQFWAWGERWWPALV